MSGGFRFRQFSVRDDRCAMRVGTDGILLGAWVDVEHATRILDIGTGCGLIALMMAQRNSAARIDAIEIDAAAARQATENVASSPWSESISVLNESLDDFACNDGPERRYDLIVCNPPFFAGSTLSADDRRKAARHGEQLTFEQLFKSVKQLLLPDGRLAIIVPFDRLDESKQLASAFDLSITKLVDVAPLTDLPPNRMLIEFANDKKSQPINSRIAVYQSRGLYSQEFWAITRHYYLPETSAVPPKSLN